MINQYECWNVVCIISHSLKPHEHEESSLQGHVEGNEVFDDALQTGKRKSFLNVKDMGLQSVFTKHWESEHRKKLDVSHECNFQYSESKLCNQHTGRRSMMSRTTGRFLCEVIRSWPHLATKTG